jgi:hypothetical protein
MNETEIPTPRTDAFMAELCGAPCNDWGWFAEKVEFFARQLERENAAMREVIKEASRVIENARFVHQAITTYAPQDAVDKVENQKHCDGMTACLEFLKPYLP